MKKVKKVNTNKLSIRNEILGIISLFFSILLLFSLISYSPYDPSFFHSSVDNVVTNYSGRIGSEISAFLFNIFGYASYIIFLYLLFLTTYFFLNRRLKNIITKSLGYFLLLISVSFFLANARPFAEKEGIKLNGGVIGYFINDIFQGEIKAFLALLLSTTLILVSLAMIAKFSLHRIFQFLFKFITKLYKAAERMVKQKVDQFQKNKRLKRIQTKYNSQPATPISKKSEGKEDLTRKEKKRIVKQPSKLPEETYLFPDVKETASNALSYKPPPMTYLDAPYQTEPDRLPRA